MQLSLASSYETPQKKDFLSAQGVLPKQVKPGGHSSFPFGHASLHNSDAWSNVTPQKKESSGTSNRTGMIGDIVGSLVGNFVGVFVGCCVGNLVGNFVGCCVGNLVGRSVGFFVGIFVGREEG